MEMYRDPQRKRTLEEYGKPYLRKVLREHLKEQEKKYEEEREEGIVKDLTNLFMAVIIGVSSSVISCSQREHEEIRDLGNLGRQTLRIAAGEDGHLDHEEKRAYLEQVGLGSTIQQGEGILNLYVKPRNSGHKKEAGVYLVEGSHLDSEDSVLHRHSQKGNTLGFIPKKTLEAYIEKEGK